MTTPINAPIAHGGALSEAIKRHGGNPSEWLDLSTGISPFTLPLPEFSPETWRRLPEQSEVQRVCELAMRHYGGSVVPVAVPGTQAAIQLLPYLTPNASEVAIVRLPVDVEISGVPRTSLPARDTLVEKISPAALVR